MGAAIAIQPPREKINRAVFKWDNRLFLHPAGACPDELPAGLFSGNFQFVFFEILR
jgi:hypothetical protein